jgi:archaellum component FlaC
MERDAPDVAPPDQGGLSSHIRHENFDEGSREEVEGEVEGRIEAGIEAAQVEIMTDVENHLQELHAERREFRDQRDQAEHLECPRIMSTDLDDLTCNI